MNVKFLLCCIGWLASFSARAQTDTANIRLDTVLTRKLSVGGFCLCQTTLARLRAQFPDLKQVEVEEMDEGKKCIAKDGRFENGVGYASDAVQGMVFQKDPSLDYISKIGLTTDFKGNLPDGQMIDLHHLTLRELFKMYPGFSDKWGSRDCSDYWIFSNDTLSFFVKIDTSKRPRYPIDEAYYMEKPVCAVDLKVSCYSIQERSRIPEELRKGPIFFMDSVRVSKNDLLKYQANDIAAITIYKDSNAIKFAGPEAVGGAVYY
jgi:hypothetical protein